MGFQPETTLPKMKKIKVYTAILNQSGTSAPVATILQNTLGIDITWVRTAEGQYEGQSNTNIFSPTKTWAMINQRSAGESIYVYADTNPDLVYLETFNGGDQYSDDILNNTAIEIRVYEE